MTLAVAGLAVAAIFLSSSAGLLSRFYDRERDFALAAESALELVRSRLVRDTSLAIPDTGVIQVVSGYQPVDASGSPLGQVRVNVFASATGDTSGLSLPFVTLIAVGYDANGTRHVRRQDLQRESFSRYSWFVDDFPAGRVFGPGKVPGRTHSNGDWRSGSGTERGYYDDSVTAVGSLSGDATYRNESLTGVPHVHYPADSTFPWLDDYAATADLAFDPVDATGPGWRSGTRLEFVTVDANGDGVLQEDEGFVRVFDLADGSDTTALNVGLEATDTYGFLARAKRWSDPVIQYQCGASYRRAGRWHFFPVAAHRMAWAKAIIQGTGVANYPAVTNPVMGQMDNYDYTAVRLILQQPTARCHPAGSPYLMPVERFTTAAGEILGGSSDTLPLGVGVAGSYGGSDTTFTPLVRRCAIGSAGSCVSAVTTLGAWRAFGGDPVAGIPTTVRHAIELPYLWPIDPGRNLASRRVVRAMAGPLFISGEVRGSVTLHVDGAVRIIDRLVYATDPSSAADPCADRLGLLATGDILVADNAMTRGRRIVEGGFLNFTGFTEALGGMSEFAMHGAFMSTTGTVGIENASSAGIVPAACPMSGSANTSGGCLRIAGSMIMRTFTPLQDGASTGYRYAGIEDPCQDEARRPPFFPTTNRFRHIRTLEVEPSQANTPAKVRLLLTRLKGAPL